MELTAGRAKLEASGGINDSTLRVIAKTSVDYISLGTLTKDVKAVDLSMRLALQASEQAQHKPNAFVKPKADQPISLIRL